MCPYCVVWGFAFRALLDQWLGLGASFPDYVYVAVWHKIRTKQATCRHKTKQYKHKCCILVHHVLSSQTEAEPALSGRLSGSGWRPSTSYKVPQTAGVNRPEWEGSQVHRLRRRSRVTRQPSCVMPLQLSCCNSHQARYSLRHVCSCRPWIRRRR